MSKFNSKTLLTVFFAALLAFLIIDLGVRKIITNSHREAIDANISNIKDLANLAERAFSVQARTNDFGDITLSFNSRQNRQFFSLLQSAKQRLIVTHSSINPTYVTSILDDVFIEDLDDIILSRQDSAGNVISSYNISGKAKYDISTRMRQSKDIDGIMCSNKGCVFQQAAWSSICGPAAYIIAIDDQKNLIDKIPLADCQRLFIKESVTDRVWNPQDKKTVFCLNFLPDSPFSDNFLLGFELVDKSQLMFEFKSYNWLRKEVATENGARALSYKKAKLFIAKRIERSCD